jgi:xanthine dehydrogenase accessory factor
LDAAVAHHAAAPTTGDDGISVITLPYRGEEATVMVEQFSPPPRLFIVGATHVAAALATQAKALGFAVTVIDARRMFATAERFPDADELVVGWPEDVLGPERLDAHGYVVVVTHDLKFDVPALAAALGSDARYIGLLGSRATIASRFERLREMGFDDAALARVQAPIGIDLGGRSPAEVALSIAAEMTLARHGRARTRGGTDGA